MAARTITAEETEVVHELVGRARARDARDRRTTTRPTVDRLCQAIAWAGGNEQTAIRLANMSVDESGMGKREPTRRAKVLGILRDALRQKSMGIIEEDPARGLVKYAKPAGVIASLIPVTSPYVTPVGIAIYAIKCKDAVIFSPHPSSRKTTIETVRLMRAALREAGRPGRHPPGRRAAEHPARQRADGAVRSDDRDRRTGDGQGGLRLRQARLRRRRRQRDDGDRRDRERRGSGAQHAHQQDQRQRLGLLRRRQPARRLARSTTPSSRSSRRKAAISSTTTRRRKLQAAYWDADGRRTADTIARRPRRHRRQGRLRAARRTRRSSSSPSGCIGKAHPFSTEKLGVVLSIFKYHGFDMALDMVRQIFETGGKGHSCGIYSFDDDHIHRLALVAPVSRIMVRQVQSSSNAGTFTNGMPMTSSMGCGVWGGNITNENISLKHYMNVTWVSRPIAGGPPVRAGAVR